jgi:apolipoprotein N-acyltransferase
MPFQSCRNWRTDFSTCAHFRLQAGEAEVKVSTAKDAGVRLSNLPWAGLLVPSVLSGLLLILCQPPPSLFFLAFVALVPLFHGLQGKGLRQSFLAGYLNGCIAYTGLLYWVVVAMNRYGGIPMFLSALILMTLVLYLALYSGLFTFLVSFLDRTFRVPFWVTAPLLWVLIEYLRGILLTGFPWSLLAHSQHNFLPFIQVASVTGSYFISFAIVMVNCALYLLWRRKGRQAVLYASVTTLVVVTMLAVGFTRERLAEPAPLKATIVQGNIGQDIKWSREHLARTVEVYREGSLGNGSGADLVIWPETALPFVFSEQENHQEAARSIAKELAATLVLGAVSRDWQGRLYNAAYVLGADGTPPGIYRKVHLVPFGEYTPLRSYLPFLERISVAGGDFFPGNIHSPVRTNLGQLGFLICYEGIFPALTGETVRRGAEVLINLTNDAWFGTTSAPYQHLAFYVFRAVETDRYVLRAANTGISAIIDPGGRVLARTAIFERTTLKGSFAMRRTTTLYVKYGDYFVLLALLALGLAIAVRQASVWFRRE